MNSDYMGAEEASREQPGRSKLTLPQALESSGLGDPGVSGTGD